LVLQHASPQARIRLIAIHTQQYSRRLGTPPEVTFAVRPRLPVENETRFADWNPASQGNRGFALARRMQWLSQAAAMRATCLPAERDR
jgi:hypothetical protein